MKRHRCVCSGLIVLASALSAQAGDTVESVEKDIIQKQAALRSLQCTSRLVGETRAGDVTTRMTAEYRIEFQRKPGGKTAGRLESRVKAEQTPKPEYPLEFGDMAVTVVFDGEYTHELRQQGSRGAVSRSKGGDSPVLFDAKAEFKTLHEDYNARLLPDGKLDGREAYVLEFTLKDGPLGALAPRMVRHFDRKTGIPLKTVEYDEAGRATMTQVFEGLKPNIEFPADHFAFKVPPGVQLIEEPGADGAASQPAG